MSYRLIDSNAIAIKYPEVNEMPCVFANLPDGMNGQFIDVQPEVLACGNGELIAQPEPHDLVSRRAALEAMDTWDKFGCDPDGKLVRYDDDKHYIPYVHYEDMVRAVKNLPPAQSEPTDINAKEAVYNLAEKIGIHQLFALTVELRGEPIQPEPQWIPVSERLPEEPGYYITSNEYNGVGEDFYYDGHFWNADKNAYEVIAWMPKPEHYKPNK